MISIWWSSTAEFLQRQRFWFSCAGLICALLVGCHRGDLEKPPVASIEGSWRVGAIIRVGKSNVDESIEHIYKFVVFPERHGEFVAEDVGHAFIDLRPVAENRSRISFEGFDLGESDSPVYKSDSGWFFSSSFVDCGLEEQKECLFAIHTNGISDGRYIVDYVLECDRIQSAPRIDALGLADQKDYGSYKCDCDRSSVNKLDGSGNRTFGKDVPLILLPRPHHAQKAPLKWHDTIRTLMAAPSLAEMIP
jgi:hypothetical protein